MKVKKTIGTQEIYPKKIKTGDEIKIYNTENDIMKRKKAFKLFLKGYTKEQVQKELNIKKSKLNYWFKGFKKWKKKNIEQRFILDFGTGKYSVQDLATKYKTDRRILLALKHKHFGKGSIKQLRMYQMHKANIPTFAIADYMNCPPQQVFRAIRKHKKNK